MPRDEGGPQEEGAGREVTTGGSESGGRALRRKLPFGRAAVLVVGERSHIVGVADVSVTGAYLSTRAPLRVGDTHLLKLLIVPDRVQIEIRAEVVRVAQAVHESPEHPRGVAVAFRDIATADLALLRSFVARSPRRRSF